jgi:thioester reductase-like protein
MSHPKVIFLTGATGFLGSHLTARLLLEGREVKVLARSSKDLCAKDRVEAALRDVGVKHFENLTVIEGDISLPGLGLNDRVRHEIALSVEEVWHCAASLSFQEENRADIFQMNVDGTRQVLDLVKMVPTHRLHHVSTAYIAGNRSDVALENEIDVGQTFRNPYEESKCRAELIISEAHRAGAVTASIYRPSIVIGDSKSGRVTHFHGVYAFIRGLWTALERMRRRASYTRSASAREAQARQGAAPGEARSLNSRSASATALSLNKGPVHLPLRVLGSENQTLNFVPIDYVVDAMYEISRRGDSVGKTYHLSNPIPTENSFWLPNICRVLGVEGIRLVSESSFMKTPMTKVEALFQKQMTFYYQYLQGEPRFDCLRTREALKNTGIQCPSMTVDLISKMAGWYVDFLSTQAARAGLTPSAGSTSLS